MQTLEVCDRQMTQKLQHLQRSASASDRDSQQSLEQSEQARAAAKRMEAEMRQLKNRLAQAQADTRYMMAATSVVALCVAASSCAASCNASACARRGSGVAAKRQTGTDAGRCQACNSGTMYCHPASRASARSCC